MKILREDASLEQFCRHIDQADRRVLFLDYDGTLAPFAPDRQRATPYAGVPDLLATILASETTRLVIVTGRAIEDLLKLLPMSPLPEIWGSHGWEHRTTTGAYTLSSPDKATQNALRNAAVLMEKAGYSQHLESKPVSVALHWRGADMACQEDMGRTATAQWEPLTRGLQLELHSFDGGIELRINGRNKGDAVRAVLAEEESTTPAAYLGDDQTDEDAFRALECRGLRILVRPELRETCADIWLHPPEELLAFLQRWIVSPAASTFP